VNASDTSDSVSSQVVDQIVHSSLSLTEDDDSGTVISLAKYLLKLWVLVIVFTKLETLLNAGVCLKIWVANLNIDWENIAERVREILNFTRPSSAPHESLAVRSHLIKYLPDVLFETHIL
jgi:hypothetical protein